MVMQADVARANAGTKASVGSKAQAAPGGWKVGFTSLEHEQIGALDLEVTGDLPRELAGTLYRIGPSRLDVYGERFRHWFDGDGMIHALSISDGKVRYQNRFVETVGKKAEDHARRRIFASFATRLPGGVLARWAARNRSKNPANTNIVAHAGKLLALCEAGRPHRIDPTTLATFGEDDMGGALAPDARYSAHPKLDRATGEMWNVGSAYARNATVHVYKTTKDGGTTRVASVVLPMAAMVHDFALTATKAVLVIAPIVLPTIPIGILSGQRSFGESLRWRPELGVRVALVDRATGETTWHECDPFMMFHTVNAFDDGADVIVDVAAYPDARIMTTTVDVMAGTTPTVARAFVERLRIRANGRVERTRRSETPVEFPRVAGRVFGQEHTRVYGVSWPDGMDFLGEPVMVDLASGKTERARMAPGEYAGECVPVSKRGATSEKDVWILTLVLDSVARRTELRVLDGADLAAPPVARVALPYVVPFGFHGNWVSQSS